MIVPERACTHARTHEHTHISSSIANLTASWYFIKIKYSEPNISAASSVSPLAFTVLLLAVIKQRCIAAGVPFWIGVELPVFAVKPHAVQLTHIYIYIYIIALSILILFYLSVFFLLKINKHTHLTLYQLHIYSVTASFY